jgi:methyl-accepting chemotaxis protein
VKTLDLRQSPMSVTALLQAARQESVRILSEDGSEFILEAADAFDQEVAELGQSEKFMSFLAERSQEVGSISLEDIEQRFL